MKPLEKLRARLSEIGVDAVIVLDEINQRYLTGFHFSDGLLFITQSKAHLMTDFRYSEAALSAVGETYTVTTESDRIKYINEQISGFSLKTVGFSGHNLFYSDYKRYSESLIGVELVDIGLEIEKIRQIKTPDEIEKMQRAQDITDSAFSHILKSITPAMTEIEVAAELEYFMRRAGAEGFAFDTIAVSGDASSLPHGVPRNEKLHRGFLTMDFGAKVDGYCSDMTRTVVIGRASGEERRLYNTVLSAQQTAISYLREGVDAGEADKVARDIIDSFSEYKGAFGHALGHSVGLAVHESPSLSRRAFGRKLRVGEILTVEPGIYLFGKYGCRIEDMVAVEMNGVRNFTKSPKHLIEIC